MIVVVNWVLVGVSAVVLIVCGWLVYTEIREYRAYGRKPKNKDDDKS